MFTLLIPSNSSNSNEVYNDDVWNYMEASIDPGLSLFLATAVYCICCLCSIPVIVILYNQYHKQKRDQSDPLKQDNQNSEVSSGTPLNEVLNNFETTLLAGRQEDLERPLLQELNDRSTAPLSVAKKSFITPSRSDEDPFGYQRFHADDNEIQEDINIQICCGENAMWKKHMLSRIWTDLKEIAKYDKETRQIIKLALPYTVTGLVESSLGIVLYILIGNFIGVRALSAYAVVELMLGLSDDFIGGIIDAAMTLIPYSVGKGNNYLAGQYVQIATFMYILASIPAAIFWSFFVYDIILWFGFDDRVADMAQSYTRVNLVAMMIEGVAETFAEFLDVTGFEVYSAVFSIVSAIIETAIYVMAFMCIENMNLVIAAYINLALTIFFSALFILIPLYKGWIDEYIQGIFCNIAFRNTFAVKNLFKVAVPFSIASILSYGEWEILTVFAAHLGPAEVAAWALLGFLWEIFEAATEAIGESAEVRVGYHLGKGDIAMARMSANKTLFVGTCFGVVMTTILYFSGDSLAMWLTEDIMIQHMIKESIPYMSLGNITMTYGMLCWYIAVSQGRYQLSTTIAFFTSWGIMMPTAGLMIYVLDFNIKSLVASVVFGYTASCTCLAVFILLSDWEEASKRIVRMNEEAGYVAYSDSESDDDNDDDSSCSSESSSSSSSPSLESMDSTVSEEPSLMSTDSCQSI